MEETRVAKYEKLREQISHMDDTLSDYPFTEPIEEEEDIPMSSDDLQEAHIKKNTLSISLNQIIKAYDTYKTSDYYKPKKAPKKERKINKETIKKVFAITAFVVLTLAALFVLFLLMISIF